MSHDLADDQWAFIKPLRPPLPRWTDGQGRSWRDLRVVRNGIVWTQRVKGCKVMVMTDRSGWSGLAGCASPHETPCVHELIEGGLTVARPERLIGDKAYDSDPLDEHCVRLGGVIAPYQAEEDAGRSCTCSQVCSTTAVLSLTKSAISKTSLLSSRSSPS